MQNHMQNADSLKENYMRVTLCREGDIMESYISKD